MEKKNLLNGAFSWNELIVPDVSKAKKFYSELLGWNMEDMESDVTEYSVAKIGDQQVAGIMKTPENSNVPPFWGSYITVKDVDASAKKTEELGGKILVPPTDIPKVGKFATLQDQQGAIFSLITYCEECKS